MNSKATPRSVPKSFKLKPENNSRIALIIPFLFLPAVAAVKATNFFGLWYVIGYFLALSAVSYELCRRDKKKALAEEWRTAESTLHMFEFLGGWPGSYVAQSKFRHKISKVSYQFSFWIIVGFYQLISLDYLQGWRLFSEVLGLVGLVQVAL